MKILSSMALIGHLLFIVGWTKGWSYASPPNGGVPLVPIDSLAMHLMELGISLMFIPVVALLDQILWR